MSQVINQKKDNPLNSNYFSDVFKIEVSDFEEERESREYNACRFNVANQKIIYRSSKVTPKKKGQFVTFYQRNVNEIIEPFFDDNDFDFLMVGTHNIENGFFVFPKSILIQKGILSTATKEGKRAFRIYTPYDDVISKQAIATQKWQTNYFYDSDKIQIDKIFQE